MAPFHYPLITLSSSHLFGLVCTSRLIMRRESLFYAKFFKRRHLLFFYELYTNLQEMFAFSESNNQISIIFFSIHAYTSFNIFPMGVFIGCFVDVSIDGVIDFPIDVFIDV